jgi:hypothetical protein
MTAISFVGLFAGIDRRRRRSRERVPVRCALKNAPPSHNLNLVAIPSSAGFFFPPSCPTQRMNPMRMQKGERWRCLNDACGGEIMVLVSSHLEGENPRCSCGSIMKKPYSKPALKTYDESHGAVQRIWEKLRTDRE